MDYEERSPLWGIGASAAVASGVGLSVYQSRNELLSALRVANKDVAAETSNIVSQLKKFNFTPTPSNVEIINQHHAGLLSLHGNQRLIKEDIAAAAYESILSGRKVSHSQAYKAFNSIMGQKDILAAYKEAGKVTQSLAGNANVFSTRIEDVLSKGNIIKSDNLYSNIDVSTGGFGNARLTVAKTDLSEEALNQFNKIESRLAAATNDPSAIHWKKFYNIEDTFGGKKITTPMAKAKIAGATVNIPLANTGVTYSGKNLTSRYVTRKAYDETGHTLNYIDRYTNMLEQVLQKKQIQSETNRDIHAINLEVLGFMKDRDAAARAQAVWNLPEEVLPAGARVKARLMGMEAVSTFGGNLNEDTISMMYKKGYTPIGSAETVAKGTLIEGDIAERIYGPLGRLFPVERQPLQFIRSEWGVTQQAKDAAKGFSGTFGKYYSRLDRKIKGSDYDKLIYGGHSPYSSKAYSSPQLMTFYAKSGELGFQKQALNDLMAAEDIAISSTVSDMLEFETITQKKISTNEGFKINKSIINDLKGAKAGQVVQFANPIGEGNFLGIDAATGKELWSEKGRTEVIAAELIGEDTATLYTREKFKMTRGQLAKLFSEDSKNLGGIVNDKEMKNILKAAGLGDRVNFAGQTIEALQTSKLLERNPMARIEQQIEIMSMITANKLDKTKSLTMRSRFAAKEFLESPEEFLKVSELMKTNQAEADYILQKNMVSLSKKFRFHQDEMQVTFGLMDESVLSRMTKEGILREKEAEVIRRSPGVFGLSKFKLGSPAGFGVGGTASIESTGLRLLAMKGEEGQAMAAELTTRLIGKEEFGPTSRMLHSAVNEFDKINETIAQVQGKNIPIDKRTFSKLNRDELIAQEGRYVELGRRVKALGGSSKLYIPGLEEAPRLMEPTFSDSGKLIPSPISRELGYLHGAIQSGDEDAIELAAKNFRNIAHKEYELAGSAKGKVLGSSFFTGRRLKVSESADDTLRISKQRAESMFGDLINAAQDSEQKAFLESQKRSLLAGESLPGTMWRHPTTGPESMQFVNYKVDPKLKDDLLMMPAKFGTFQSSESRFRKVDISQAVGLKGDFDKDMYALSAISDASNADKVRRSLQHKTQAEYTSYLFNHYTMGDALDKAKNKASKTIGEMTRLEALQSGAKKLTEAKIATPEVNLALQKMKMGLSYSAPEEYKPLSELFWHLEEAAIGGKHGTIDEVAGTSLYQNIARAYETKDVNRMENVLTDLFGKQRIVTGAINGSAQQTDINPAKWARIAIESSANISDEIDMAHKATRIAKGTANASNAAEIVKMINMRKSGSVDIAQSLMHSNFAGAANISEKASRKMQQGAAKASAIGRALSKNKKYAIAGIAAAAGIGLMAPSISGSLNTNPEGARGGRNIQPDDIGPPSGLEMNPPSARIQRSPRNYDISGLKQSSRANIRMSSNDYENNSDRIMANARKLAEGSNTNIRTIDDRSILDAHRLASKIHERL